MTPFEWALPKTVYQAKQKLLFLKLKTDVTRKAIKQKDPVSPLCAND